MGRINFGRAIKDFKGITDSALLNGKHLNHWLVYNLPDDYEIQKEQPGYVPMANDLAKQPGYYYGTFNLKKVGDTFINMESWGKGQLYIFKYRYRKRFEKSGKQSNKLCYKKYL